MRLLIVGTLKGQLTTATKIAMENGASVTHAEDHEQAMRVLRGGKGADLLLVDVALDIRDLVLRLEAEHIHVPIVACGISSDARAAVAAIHAGAKEYIPLPPDPELIAAVLAAVANDSRDMVYRDEAMAKVIKLAQQIAGVHRFYQQLVREVFALEAGQRESCEHGHCRAAGSLFSRSNNLCAGAVAFHAHVGNHHVILMGADLHLCFARRRRSFYFKAVDFVYGFQREQYRQLIVNQ